MADTEASEKNANVENTENTENVEKNENTDKTENKPTENTENTDKAETIETTEDTENAENTVKSENDENTEKTEKTENADNNEANEKNEKNEKSDESDEPLPPKAFVGNLPSKTPIEELKKLFEPYGPIVKCDVVKRWGFVRLTNQVDVDRAIKELNKTEFKGSVITVEQCRGHRSTKKPTKELTPKEKEAKKRKTIARYKKKWSEAKKAKALKREKRRAKKEAHKKLQKEKYIAKRRELFMLRKQIERFGNGGPPPQGFANNSNMPFNRGFPDNFSGPYNNYGGPDMNFDNRRYNDSRDMRSFPDNFDNRNLNMGNMGMRDSFNQSNERFQGNFPGRTPPFDSPMDNRMFDSGFDNNRGQYGPGPGPNFSGDNRFNQDTRSFRDNRGPEPLMDNQRNMPSFNRGDQFSRDRMMGSYNNRDYQDMYDSDRNFGSFNDNRGEPEPLMSRNIDNRFMGNKSVDGGSSRGMNFSPDNYRRPMVDDRRSMMDDQPRFDKRMMSGGHMDDAIPPINNNPSRLMDIQWSGGPSMGGNNRNRSMDDRRTPPRNFNDERSRSPAFRSRSPPSKQYGDYARSPPRSPLFDRRNSSTNEIFRRRMPDNMNCGPDNSMNRDPSGNMNRIADNSGNRFAGGPGNKDWRGPPRRF